MPPYVRGFWRSSQRLDHPGYPPICTDVDEYPRLARALLDAGESPAAVARFLVADYRLDDKQAKAAIRLGRMLDPEAPDVTPPLSRRVRVLRLRMRGTTEFVRSLPAPTTPNSP